MNRTARYALLAGLALLPWSRLTTVPGLTRAAWADGAFLVALAAAVPAMRRRPAVDGLPRWAAGALGAYLLWSAISVAASDDLDEALRLLGARVLCALLFVLFLHAMSDASLRRSVARVVAANAVVIAVGAVVAFALFRAGRTTAFIGSYGTLAPSRQYARVRMGTGNPNLLASYALFSAAVVLGFRRELPGWLWKAGAAASVIALAGTLSKAAVGGAVLVAALATERWRLRRAMPVTLVGASLVVLAASVWQVRVDSDQPWRWSVSHERAERSVLMQASAREVLRHPILGTGLGDLPRVDATVPPKRPHLTVLDVAVSTGVPAAAFLLTFLAGCWVGRRRPTSLVLWGGLGALAVDALRQDATHFRHVWILLAVAVAVAATHDRTPVVPDERMAPH